MNKDKTKQTAAQRAFSLYTKQISELIISKYGPSYSTYEDVKNTWRNVIPYTKEIENFLIFQTKMYIRLLDSRDPNSTNLQFLSALIYLIADYLSAYTMHADAYLTRKKAKEYLKKELYENSA